MRPRSRPAPRTWRATRTATSSGAPTSTWRGLDRARGGARRGGVDAKLVWRPQTTTELDLEAAQSLMKLIEALEDDDDVQSVTANFEISDEVMAQL